MHLIQDRTVTFEKITIVLMLTLFFIFLRFSNAHAASFCFTNDSKGDTLKYTLNASEVTSSTTPGSVVGTLTYSGAYFSCPVFSQSGLNDWRLYITSNAPATGSKNTICTTNIKGIGIEYYDKFGRSFACNSNLLIAIFYKNDTKARNINPGQLMARLIRLSGELDSNGPQTLKLNAYLNHSVENSSLTNWGYISNAGSDIINTTNYVPLIYFPLSQNSQPLVRMDIKRKLPGTRQDMVSTSNLDMCLYDGNNSNSSSIKLVLSDEGNPSPNRTQGLFSIYRQGSDRNLIENRIDYSVSVLNPTNNSRQYLNNGESIIWNNTNNRSKLRQVVLPNIPGISFCVPAPLTFDTGNYNTSEKNAGHYLGVLTVVYTPNT